MVYHSTELEESQACVVNDTAGQEVTGQNKDEINRDVADVMEELLSPVQGDHVDNLLSDSPSVEKTESTDSVTVDSESPSETTDESPSPTAEEKDMAAVCEDSVLVDDESNVASCDSETVLKSEKEEDSTAFDVKDEALEMGEDTFANIKEKIIPKPQEKEFVSCFEDVD